jgi:hypothetical protein
MRGYYVLNDDHTFRAVDMVDWSLGGREGDERRRVGVDYIDKWEVSTVFIGIDMTPSFAPADSPPRVFETMLFAPEGVTVIGRPYSWEQAETLHNLTVNALRAVIASGAEVYPVSVEAMVRILYQRSIRDEGKS